MAHKQLFVIVMLIAFANLATARKYKQEFELPFFTQFNHSIRCSCTQFNKVPIPLSLVTD